MITENELRIGNLVMYNGMTMRISEICSPKPMKDKRYSDKYIIELFDGAGLISCAIDEIHSIPLTEEWLLKFGFKKLKHSNEWYVIMIYGTELSVHLSGYEICFGNGQNYIKGDFKHIHKIQNLYFALTNKELTSCQ